MENGRTVGSGAESGSGNFCSHEGLLYRFTSNGGLAQGRSRTVARISGQCRGGGAGSLASKGCQAIGLHHPVCSVSFSADRPGLQLRLIKALKGIGLYASTRSDQQSSPNTSASIAEGPRGCYRRFQKDSLGTLPNGLCHEANEVLCVLDLSVNIVPLR